MKIARGNGALTEEMQDVKKMASAMLAQMIDVVTATQNIIVHHMAGAIFTESMDHNI